ncbi:tryptophan synthase, alpha chain [Gemmobacter megaterium]|uniref:Tryptophan synthase, alpha chain n=1 Tax=Gemmobacter megaterium TaxID=1086013 RepID=A0A1N7JY51_9RHOB|nr:HPP family protein [Gemmobacter megaterium]SIS54269.1 tryptophan synthase, alpha chain [Gemmobacter megaterium]
MSRSSPRFSLSRGLHRLIQAFRPPPGQLDRVALMRVSAGTALAVLLAGAFVAAVQMPVMSGLALIAPFGASALLVVGVPNSPMAQPWPLLVGNGGAAVLGVLAAHWVPWPLLAAALALGGAVAFMYLARALHPPAGAISLLPVLEPEIATDLGLRFALMPVISEGILLLAFGMVWHRATGRVYPYRQMNETPRAAQRFSASDLAMILARLRLSANIGVADFARLLAATDEMRFADQCTEGLVCSDVAGPPPAPLAPDTPLAEARTRMLAQRAYALPVTDAAGQLVGIVSQSDLLRADPARTEAVVADSMTAHPVSLSADAPLRKALSVLAEGGWRSVPLTDGDGRFVAMLSRADLIDILAHRPGATSPLQPRSPSGIAEP